MDPAFELEGIRDRIEVFRDKVRIRTKGFKGLVEKVIKGTKTIPFTGISILSFQKSGPVSAGFMRFTREYRARGAIKNVFDQYTITFDDEENEAAENIVAFIQKRAPHLKEDKAATPAYMERMKKQGFVSNVLAGQKDIRWESNYYENRG